MNFGKETKPYRSMQLKIQRLSVVNMRLFKATHKQITTSLLIIICVAWLSKSLFAAENSGLSPGSFEQYVHLKIYLLTITKKDGHEITKGIGAKKQMAVCVYTPEVQTNMSASFYTQNSYYQS